MIYYTASNGTIIGGTAGSDLSGITHLPSGADYAIFVNDATVNGLNPSNAPGTYSFTGVTAGPTYTVPTASGTLTFTEQSAADQLSNAKTAQITKLRQGYVQTMASGFNFTIGTTQYVFGWSTDDKTNMDGTQTAVSKAFLTFPIQYSDIHGNPVSIPDQTTLDNLEHTATNFFSNNHQQVLNLIGNVNSATTVSGVEAVTWTPATY